MMIAHASRSTDETSDPRRGLMSPSQVLLVALTATLVLAAAPASAVTVIASDGFETYANGASLTSGANGFWVRDGSGAASVTTTAGLANGGTHAALLAPPSGTTGSWVYKTNTVLANPAASVEPVVTTSVDLSIKSPASGTANRSVVLGLQTYTTTVDLIASTLLVWDGANTFGLGTNHLVIEFNWFTDKDDATGSGFRYDLGAVTSAQLSSVGYFNVSMALNYASGDIAFSWGNSTLGIAYETETTHGTFDPTSFTNFSDADLYYGRGSTGGTLPRLLADNYSITTSAAAAVPEPQTWGLMAGGLLALAMLRRRREA